jgi:hypothetical protein
MKVNNCGVSGVAYNHVDLLLGAREKSGRLKYALRNIRRPSYWAVSTRRVFLLALPVALPIWISLVAASLLVLLFQELMIPVLRFWSAPPKRKRGLYETYGLQTATDRR